MKTGKSHQPRKFRVWSPTYNKMYYDNFSINSSGKVSWSSVAEIHADVDNLILMQFTGLVNHRGKEVWEGDIVKCGTSNTASIAVIAFGAQAFLLTYLPLEKKEEDNTYDLIEDYKHLTVLGNAYENPEICLMK